MKITSKTKYEDFMQYEAVLTAEQLQQIKQAAEEQYKSCYMLTIDEFFGILAGDYSLLGDMSKPSVLQVYWLKRFADFCDEFSKACERMTLKDPTKPSLTNGCVKVEPQEGMLIFLREYFDLPSFFAAGERTIGEYLTARKDRYNDAVMRKNYEAEQRRKMKVKR